MKPGTPTDHLPPPSGPAEAVHRRFEALERDNRRLRRLGLIMLVGVAVLLGLTSAIMVVAARHGMPGMVPEISESRKYLLRDRTGTIRAALGTNEDGTVQLVLSDTSGQSRLRLSVLADGSSGVAFVDSANSARVVVGVLPDESANLVLADPGGKTRVVLGLTPNGAATLVFADRGGVSKAGIGIDTRGLGTLNLVERPGQRIGEELDDPDGDASADTSPQPPPARR